MTGRPAPCTLSKLLRTLGYVLTWTEEQPKGTDMGTGGRRTLGKTPWPSWPCKAVGSMTEHRPTWQMFSGCWRNLSSSAHVLDRDSHGARSLCQPNPLGVFSSCMEATSTKKGFFFFFSTAHSKYCLESRFLSILWRFLPRGSTALALWPQDMSVSYPPPQLALITQTPWASSDSKTGAPKKAFLSQEHIPIGLVAYLWHLESLLCLSQFWPLSSEGH